MDRWATKNTVERQDDEASRLVRPSPKYKPPRRDLRRENVSPESDSDSERDPDESRNFKDIGGSVQRIAQRFARDTERIPAKSKETGETVNISPDTLKEQPDKYEALDSDEAESAPKEPKVDAPAEPKAEGETPKKPENKEQHYQQAGDALRALAKDDPQLKATLKKFTTPGEFFHGMVEQNPDFEASKLFKNIQLPEGIKTISDMKRALETKPSAPKAKGKKTPEKPAEAEKPKGKAPEPLADAEESKRKPSKEKVELPEKPAPVEGEPTPPEEALKDTEKTEEKPVDAAPSGAPEPDEAPAKGKEKGKKDQKEPSPKPPSESQKHGIADPVRNPASQAERQEALSLLLNTFEPEMAANFASLHPADVKTLVRDYNTAKLGVKIAKPSDFAEKVSHFFQTDPAKVKPPAMGTSKTGQKVPFESLSPEEQSTAMREHQMRTVALSMAAQEALSKKLSNRGMLSGKPRIPEKLTSTLAKAMLTNTPPEKADEIATKVYDSTLASGDPPPKIGDNAVRNFLEQVKGNPVASKMAKAYLQANDYQLAKDEFLNKPSSAISERDSPAGIVDGLKKVGKYFQKRNALYGDDHEVNPSQTLFRTKVMDRLRSLEPEKAAKVQTLLGRVDHEEYSDLHKKWKTKHGDWEKRKAAHEKAAHAYLDSPEGKKPLGKFAEEEPKEPTKPVTSSPDEKPEDSASIWDDAFEQAPKTASVFTYSRTPVMGSTNKTGVYHGVDPYAYGPPDYPGWMQPHQRDLGDSDYRTILAEAKEFLGSSLLDVAQGGMNPDAKFRAALDLAIYSSRYNGAINATEYSKLLAKLAGEPEPAIGQTLMTVTAGEKSSSDSTSSFTPTPSDPTGEVTTMKASREVRKFAALVAKVDAKTAFEMTEFADRLAEDEKKMPPWLKDKFEGKGDDKDDKKEDKGQQQKEASDKYASLKSTVIKAANADPAARAAYLPLLQAIKALG